jgi:NAD(P)H dehydrogenase (quinone)
MQVLVMYYSRTGNTKKLAQEIAKGVEEIEDVTSVVKDIKEITENDFLACDAIIAGSPVYYGSMAGEMKMMFDRFDHIRNDMEGKIGAAFATSGDNSGGKETTMMAILQVLLIYGMIVVGDPMDATGHYGVACTGSPDKTACENAAKLGKRVASLVKQIRED